MTVDTVAIPQADRIWDVARVATLVAQGVNTPEALGAALGDKVARQGHYYTQAARTLGLVGEPLPDGRVELTPYGRAFARYDRSNQRQALRRLLGSCEPTRSVLAALRARGELRDADVAALLQQLAPLATSTARRRAQTVILWLETVGLVTRREQRLRLG